MLENLLKKKKSAILDRWFHLILGTYPADTSRFLENQKDRFQNPMGHAFSKGTKNLFDELQEGADPKKLTPLLDDLIKIRSVQEFSASQAVAVVFLLKKAIREKLKEELQEARVLGELLEFESRIDEMALLAFDVYMQCREKIYQIRTREQRRRSYPLSGSSERCQERRKQKEDLNEGEN